MPNSLVPHWEAAYARALQQHALDGSERDVLALTLALVASEDGTAIEDISLWSVRYRLGDEEGSVQMDHHPGERIPVENGQLVLTPKPQA